MTLGGETHLNKAQNITSLSSVSLCTWSPLPRLTAGPNNGGGSKFGGLRISARGIGLITGLKCSVHQPGAKMSSIMAMTWDPWKVGRLKLQARNGKRVVHTWSENSWATVDGVWRRRASIANQMLQFVLETKMLTGPGANDKHHMPHLGSVSIKDFFCVCPC